MLDISLSILNMLFDCSTTVKHYCFVEQRAQIGGGNPPPLTKDTSLLLDIQSASDFLGLTIWQVRGLISQGLPVVRVGRKFYFRRVSLTRWVERMEEKLT
jgi:hypothetical protein